MTDINSIDLEQLAEYIAYRLTAEYFFIHHSASVELYSDNVIVMTIEERNRSTRQFVDSQTFNFDLTRHLKNYDTENVMLSIIDAYVYTFFTDY